MRLGIDAVYENYDLADINDLVEILQTQEDLKGLNVTIPYKQDVMQFLDELDPIAEKIGAVNVVKIKHLDKSDSLFDKTKIKGLFLKGFNSDIIGFTDSIKPMLDESHKKALILGTGGASKAIKVALETMNIETACMVEPFLSGKKGGRIVDEVKMSELIIRLNELGFDFHVHTVGDGASRTVLDAVELARKALGAAYRTRVTTAHLEVIHKNDLKRFSELIFPSKTTTPSRITRIFAPRFIVPSVTKHPAICPTFGTIITCFITA